MFEVLKAGLEVVVLDIKLAINAIQIAWYS
jgi:hypothetical protein